MPHLVLVVGKLFITTHTNNREKMRGESMIHDFMPAKELDGDASSACHPGPVCRRFLHKLQTNVSFYSQSARAAHRILHTAETLSWHTCEAARRSSVACEDALQDEMFGNRRHVSDTRAPVLGDENSSL
jgi:hypothetical protein